MSGKGELLAVAIDGTARWVPNTYEGVKDGLDGATLDAVRVSEKASFYINDNGIIERQALNIPASMFAGRAIYGPVVLMHGDPDAWGNEQPPRRDDANLMQAFCRSWQRVCADIKRLNQPEPIIRSDDTLLPPPQIIDISGDEEFARWLEGRLGQRREES